MKSCDTGATTPTERVAVKVGAIPVLSVGDKNLVVAATMPLLNVAK